MNPHDKLLLYMRGFHAGAGVKAFEPNMERYDDFKRGLDDGRQARQNAYQRASEYYGANLSVIKTATGMETPMIKCEKCGKPLRLVNHTFVFSCQCYTYAVPVKADGTAIMPNGKIVNTRAPEIEDSSKKCN